MTYVQKSYSGFGFGKEYTVKEGFYKDYPDGEDVYYYVRGRLRNIGDKPIDSVSIVGKFFDEQDNFLCESDRDFVRNLYLNESKSFKVYITTGPLGHWDCEYFNYVEKYTIDYSVILHE